VSHTLTNCQEYSLKWINKTAGFVKCFFGGIFADSIIFYAQETEKYKTDMCGCYTIARLCKLQTRGSGEPVSLT